MTIEEYISRLRATVIDLRNSREVESIVIAKDVLAMVKSRVINKGQDENNQKIGDYSLAVVPVYFYKNKEKRVGDAVEKLRKKYGNFASYKDWREVNNLGVEFKNYSFTGHMWASVYPIVVEKDAGSVTIAITASTDNALQKLRYAVGETPGLLKLNDRERELMITAQRNRLVKVLERNGIK